MLLQVKLVLILYYIQPGDLYGNDAEPKYRTVVVNDNTGPVISISKNPATAAYITSIDEQLYTDIADVTAYDIVDGQRRYQ